MRINKIYIDKFKKYSYGYMYMIKRGVFLLFDLNSLEYKGVLNMIPYSEMKDVYPTIEKLVALDLLEVEDEL